MLHVLYYWLFKLFFAVNAPVCPCGRVGQLENMGDFLLNGSDASGVFALDHIGYGFRQGQVLFLDDLSAVDNVDRNVVVNESQNIQIQFHRPLDLYNIFFAHFIAGRIFNNSNLAVQLFQL